MDDLTKQAVIDMFQNLAHEDWTQGVTTTWAEAFSEVARMIRDFPSIQPDIYKALQILNAINSSGRLDYGDYCDLHDAILEIGGYKNG